MSKGFFFSRANESVSIRVFILYKQLVCCNIILAGGVGDIPFEPGIIVATITGKLRAIYLGNGKNRLTRWNCVQNLPAGYLRKIRQWRNDLWVAISSACQHFVKVQVLA